MRKIIVAVLFLGLCVAAWWYLTTPLAPIKPPQIARKVEVEFITIAPQQITLSKILPGRTSAYRVVEIRPQVSGIITHCFFAEGSDVVAGQQLYQIDPAPYQAAYESAAADLLKAESSVTSIQAKVNRYAELVKIGAISKQDYDDAAATLAQNAAHVAVAKAALATAKINLDYTKVFSPISGRIGRSLVSEGALATANQAQPLAIVQQLDPIYVDVTESSGDVLQLCRSCKDSAKGGAKPQVTLLLNKDAAAYEKPGYEKPGYEKQGYEKQGEVQFSDSRVDPTTGCVSMRILFENPNHEILPGLFVRAQIAKAKEDPAILVPQCSVSHHSDHSVTVWKVTEENKVLEQPITVAQVVGNQWLVTEGLLPGDRVVVSGMQKLAPNMAVSAVGH